MQDRLYAFHNSSHNLILLDGENEYAVFVCVGNVVSTAMAPVAMTTRVMNKGVVRGASRGQEPAQPIDL
ncbi:hypothetical protein HRUBRA_02736 [Pseudohaliea rubra DSM 19751]|uniref:Uncharacterized protein n=1 Tax=Pseudohaliea rubra DSM 19751 TaxID=1265313 RepID=A0A095VNR9_9GAMM|nr:hypothetical protein [Pseudohaliea rubra]KGE02758.1 hypothetical protein HRUBRA_02736 [Pseudohaliea rubra DSM 19751]